MNDDLNQCDGIRNQLLEFNSTETLTADMKKHFDRCDACTEFYQDILAINQGVESMPEHDVSDEVFKQTLQAVQASNAVSKNKGINPQWATGLAASFVLVAVAGLIYNGSISEYQADFNQIPAISESEPIGQNSVEKDGLRWRDSTDKDQRFDIQLKEGAVNKQQMSLDQSLQTLPAPKPTVSGTMDEILIDDVFGMDSAELSDLDEVSVVGSRKISDKLIAEVPEPKNMPKKEARNQRLMPLDHLLKSAQRAATEEPLSIIADTVEEISIEELESSKSTSHAQIKAQIKQRRFEMAKNKPKSELSSKDDSTEFKEFDSEPSSVAQSQPIELNEGLMPDVKGDEISESENLLGGALGRHSGVVDVSTQYMADLQNTENLSFKSATGYWANSYLPGDANMRWIQAKLKQDNGLNLPDVRQNIQPFDYPSNAALGLYLNSDHKTLNEAGPTRMRLQVGIQAGQQKGGQRAALNLAVVLDLGQQKSTTEVKEESKALLSALLKAKQPADQISVYLTGAGGQVIAADDFRHGPIQVVLEQIFSPKTAVQTLNTDLYQTLSAANSWLKTQDDPNAVLGSSAVLLVSANNEFTGSSSIESMVQNNAIDGITLSTVSLTGIEAKNQLERLALMGQGHSRILAGAHDAQRLINQELLVSARAVARALRLQIKLAEGVQLIDVLGSYSLNEVQAQKVRDAEQSLDQRLSKNLGIAADRGKDDDGIQIVIPSYFAGDTHVILLDVLVNQPGPVAEVSAKYKDLIYLRNATSQKNLYMTSGQNNLGPLELNVMKNVLAHRLSQTINQASQAIRSGDQDTAMEQLKAILELYQGMRQQIPAWHSDTEMRQDEAIIKQYLQLLNSQSSINPKQYQLIADSMSFMSWRKLISHSP